MFKKNTAFFKAFIGIVCALFGTACVSSTTIRSNNPKAKIYINDEFMGQGSVEYADAAIIGTRHSVKLRERGCREQQYYFTRNEEVDVGAVVGGILFLFPFLWTMKYKPMHNYEYECVPTTGQ